MTTKTVELYNICRAGRAVSNGWLVRVVDNGRTTFVRYGVHEVKAREFAASDRTVLAELQATLADIRLASNVPDLVIRAETCTQAAFDTNLGNAIEAVELLLADLKLLRKVEVPS